jgi:hypothetical protein
VDLVEDLAASFTLQDSAPSNANLESVASARPPRRKLGIAVSGLGKSVISQSLGRSSRQRGRSKQDDQIIALFASYNKLVLRCIQMIQFRTQSSRPALCRVSTESGKACALSRGWPGQARPRRSSESSVWI